jgi:hypothetical protein
LLSDPAFQLSDSLAIKSGLRACTLARKRQVAFGPPLPFSHFVTQKHRGFKQIRKRCGDLDWLSAAGKDTLISCGEMFVREAKWHSSAAQLYGEQTGGFDTNTCYLQTGKYGPAALPASETIGLRLYTYCPERAHTEGLQSS